MTALKTTLTVGLCCVFAIPAAVFADCFIVCVTVRAVVLSIFEP